MPHWYVGANHFMAEPIVSDLMVSLSQVRLFVFSSVFVFLRNEILSLFCLFIGYDSLRPINNFSVKQGWVFMG